MLHYSCKLLTLLIIFIASFACVAQCKIKPSQKEAYEKFKAEYGKNWKIKWNSLSGTPSSLYGSKIRLKGKDYEKEAKKILNKYLGLYEIKNIDNDIKFRKINNYGSISKVIYEQYYKEIPYLLLKFPLQLTSIMKYLI